VVAAGGALQAGEITVVDAGIEALDTGTHIGVHGAAAARRWPVLGLHISRKLPKQQDFRRAVDAALSNSF